MQISANRSRSTDSEERCIADGRSDVNSTSDRNKTHHVGHFDDVKFPVALTSQRNACRSEPSILTTRIVTCQTGCCAAKTQQRKDDGSRKIPDDWRIRSNGEPSETVFIDPTWQHPQQCTCGRLVFDMCNHRSTVTRTLSCPASSVNRSTLANGGGDDVMAFSHVMDDRMSRDYRCKLADSEYGEELQAAECERRAVVGKQTGIVRNVLTYVPRQLV